MQRLQQFLVWCAVPGTIFPGLMSLAHGTKWQFVVGLMISAALVAKAYHHPTMRLWPKMGRLLDLTIFLVGVLMAELLLMAIVGPRGELFANTESGWVYLVVAATLWYLILSLEPRGTVAEHQVAREKS